MTDSDRQLVDMALNGDRAAFGKLVLKYQKAIYATAYHLVGRFDVAEDLAQESFLEAYRCLSGLRDPAKFGAWLRGIARRVCMNWLSRRKPGVLFFDSIIAVPAPRAVEASILAALPTAYVAGWRLLEEGLGAAAREDFEASAKRLSAGRGNQPRGSECRIHPRLGGLRRRLGQGCPRPSAGPAAHAIGRLSNTL